MIVPAFLRSQTEQDKFDILIKGGTVYDGTGADPFQADAGVKVVAIGKSDSEQALDVVDANGLALPLASSICSPGRLCL